MRLKQYLRFGVLFCFIILAAIIPVPIKFYSKDNLPSFKIEQIDQKKEDEEEDDIYQYKS